MLTDLLEHLVTLVENKVLDARAIEDLVPGKRVHTPRCANDDVGALGLVFEQRLVLLDGGTAVDDRRPDIGHVFAEAGVFVANLVGQLTRVAEDDDADFAVDGLDLLQCCENKHGSLAHTRLGLADDIHAEDRLGNAFLLD